MIRTKEGVFSLTDIIEKTVDVKKVTRYVLIYEIDDPEKHQPGLQVVGSMRDCFAFSHKLDHYIKMRQDEEYLKDYGNVKL